jgi:hypothetical protein
MDLLIPQLLNESGWDELLIWSNPQTEDDKVYLKSLSEVDERIRLIELTDEERNRNYSPGEHWHMSLTRFWHHVMDTDTIYIRFDDDVVYVEPGTVEKIVAARLRNHDAFLVVPVVINNAVFNNKLYISKKLDNCPYVFNEDPYGKENLFSGKCTEWLHDFLLAKIKTNSVSDLYIDDYELPNNRHLSINCICFFGKDIATFNGIMPLGHLEEPYIAVHRPVELGRNHLVVGNTVVAHFAFGPQREYMNCEKVLTNYKNIL